MLRDHMNNIDLAGAAVTANADNTATVGPIVDCKGAKSVTFAIGAGTLADADATFTALVEESAAANMSGSNAVADADLIGTEVLASFTFAADQLTRKIGYKGSLRYVRCTVTPANNTGAAPIAIIPIVEKDFMPTANPTA